MWRGNHTEFCLCGFCLFFYCPRFWTQNCFKNEKKTCVKSKSKSKVSVLKPLNNSMLERFNRILSLEFCHLAPTCTRKWWNSLEYATSSPVHWYVHSIAFSIYLYAALQMSYEEISQRSSSFALSLSPTQRYSRVFFLLQYFCGRGENLWQSKVTFDGWREASRTDKFICDLVSNWMWQFGFCTKPK